MEDFKRVIQRRNFILKCLILLAVILDIVLNIIPIDPQLDIATSFQIGLLIGLSLSFMMIRFSTAFLRAGISLFPVWTMVMFRSDTIRLMIATKSLFTSNP